MVTMVGKHILELRPGHGVDKQVAQAFDKMLQVSDTTEHPKREGGRDECVHVGRGMSV